MGKGFDLQESFLFAFARILCPATAGLRGASFGSWIRRSRNMLNLECKTALAPEKVLEELKRSFGKGGLGLEVKEENEQCITFEGGGGYITATLCKEKGKTRVEMVTQEWDYQVKQFASKLR
jgi:hypothetical protein